MKKQSYFSVIFLILTTIFFGTLTSNAANKNDYGVWKSDNNTKTLIESGKLLPNHTYYYSGSMNGPECFIAIDNQFTLAKSHVWAKADEISEKVLAKWIQFIKTEGGPDAANLRGGVILTPDGKKAGVWYSHYSFNIVQMTKHGELVVFQPHPVGGGHTTGGE